MTLRWIPCCRCAWIFFVGSDDKFNEARTYFFASRVCRKGANNLQATDYLQKALTSIEQAKYVPHKLVEADTLKSDSEVIERMKYSIMVWV